MTAIGSGREDLSLPKMSRQALGPIYSPIQWTPKDFSRGMEHTSGRVSQNSFNKNEVLCSEFFSEFLFPYNNASLGNKSSCNRQGNDPGNDDVTLFVTG